MEVGIVGLGRMGSGVAARLIAAGHRVVVYNRSLEKTKELAAQGAEVATSLQELTKKLSAGRVIWLYLPSGSVTRAHIEELAENLEKGDVLLDGGNSRFSNTVETAAWLSEQGVELLDVGTSGGIRGKEQGYCLMIGGTEVTYQKLMPLWQAVAQPDGQALVGPVGAGHYVKMVHNAIEYGMMEAYGEGMELLASSQFAEELDLSKVAQVWQQGSIISSFLGGLLAEAMTENPALEGVGGRIDDNGEGRWAVEEALQRGVSLPVIASSMFVRYASRKEQPFGHKIVAILRAKFGGHAIEVLKK